MQTDPFLAISAMITALVLVFFNTHIIASGLIHLAGRTQIKIDDILVKHLKPLRMSWLAPVTLIYLLAFLFLGYQSIIEKGLLFLILWIFVLTVTSLFNAINDIYENRSTFNGVSIEGYLGILKILIIFIAIILSVSLFSGESPVVLLTGLGALTAVLLLIFQNTIISLVASVQINSMDFIKEGEWIEVPSYDSDGDVVNISLHTIKVQNFDMTTTVILTHKIMDVAYKNWRGMQESCGGRIQRSILIDMTSMRFCDNNMLTEISKIDLIQNYLNKKLIKLKHIESAFKIITILHWMVLKSQIPSYFASIFKLTCVHEKIFIIKVCRS